MCAYIADESPEWNGRVVWQAKCPLTLRRVLSLCTDSQENIAYLSAQGWGLPFLRHAFASNTFRQ